MPPAKTTKEIRKIVEDENDTYVNHKRSKKYKKNGELTKKEETLVTYECGICGTNEERPLDQYQRWGGHCKECKTSIKAKGQKVTNDEKKNSIESKTPLKVLSFRSEIIDVSCGVHNFSRTWGAFCKNSTCNECKKSGKEQTHVSLAVKNTQGNKNTQTIVEEPLQNIDVPDNYVLLEQKNKRLLLKCDQNHIFRIDDVDEIYCPYHDLDVRSASQAKSQREVTIELKKLNAKLLSTYVNDKTLLELQCTKCNNLFYKSYQNFTKHDSVCTTCVKNAVAERKKQECLEKKIEFRRNVENSGWQWVDDNTEYVHNRTKFKIICVRGHEKYTCQDDFVNGKRDCNDCANTTRATKSMLTIKEVKDICANSGFTLLDKEYTGTKNVVHVKCVNCLENMDIIFDTMRRGRCPKCNSSKSAGALRVQRVLESNPNVVCISEEFSFGAEYQVNDDWFHCKDVNVLRYDFKVELVDGSDLFVEFDGSQHFESIEFFGGKEAFIKRRQHDLLKNLYCDYNNKHMLRIAQKDFKRIRAIINNHINMIIKNKPLKYLWYSSIIDYADFIKEYVDYEPPENLNKKENV